MLTVLVSRVVCASCCRVEYPFFHDITPSLGSCSLELLCQLERLRFGLVIDWIYRLRILSSTVGVWGLLLGRDAKVVF